MKTLLLEASPGNTRTHVCCKEYEQRLHDGEIVSFSSSNPYCMMLERVIEYLTAIEDFTRLDLVRRCFYPKVCKSSAVNAPV
ncbi:class I adenylate cyclase [Escherichia coli]